ncbi:hypothetical protein [Nocardia carnea]|nr:hypothetical protein [Nocardia carnea]
MYWVVGAPRLHESVAQHAQLGSELLREVPSTAKSALGRAVSESSLLAGRIEFFDLQKPDRSQASFVLALQAAHEANDALLGAATLTHMAFAPAFSGDSARAEEARERLRAARVFARRGNANFEMTAWIDAVEAEAETRFGDTRQALKLLRRAEETYDRHEPAENPSPPWLDWFSPTRLAGFKGYTLMVAGRGREARESLELALADLPDNATKQRAVFLADIGAAAVLEEDPELACVKLGEALDLISSNWYATALDRIKSVRNTLRPWDSLPSVRALDERMYDWHTTVSSVGG